MGCLTALLSRRTRRNKREHGWTVNGVVKDLLIDRVVSFVRTFHFLAKGLECRLPALAMANDAMSVEHQSTSRDQR